MKDSQDESCPRQTPGMRPICLPERLARRANQVLAIPTGESLRERGFVAAHEVLQAYPLLHNFGVEYLP